MHLRCTALMHLHASHRTCTNGMRSQPDWICAREAAFALGVLSSISVGCVSPLSCMSLRRVVWACQRRPATADRTRSTPTSPSVQYTTVIWTESNTVHTFKASAISRGAKFHTCARRMRRDRPECLRCSKTPRSQPRRRGRGPSRRSQPPPCPAWSLRASAGACEISPHPKRCRARGT